MPANDGIRFDDDKNSLPLRPESEEGNPENSVQWRDLGFCLLLAVRGELLAKGQFDYCLLIATSEKGRSTTEKENQKVE